jgi:hypothetical protein
MKSKELLVDIKRLFPWEMLCLFLFLANILVGCATKAIILHESNIVYYIPAGTEFLALTEKGGKLNKITRDKPSWVVDSGYLLKLQEEANKKVFDNY